jgi:hypothetical protein
MSYDLKSMLKIPKDVAAPLLSEARANAEDDQAEWARYGRAVHRLLHSDQFQKEIRAAMLWDSYPPAMAERLRGFLAKAEVNSP